MKEMTKPMNPDGTATSALRAKERSDEARKAEVGAPADQPTIPDPEVVAIPTRRRFTAEYRLRILDEADRCTGPGDVGRLLRREGLYSSHLTNWRKSRREGALKALTPAKRGVKPAQRNPLQAKVRALEERVAHLEGELQTAHTILDVQGKVAGLLGLNLKDAK
jgi:transposase-like protein